MLLTERGYKPVVLRASPLGDVVNLGMTDRYTHPLAHDAADRTD
jgi:hypothetical protein